MPLSYLEPIVRDTTDTLGAGTSCSVLVARDGVLLPGPSSDPRSASCDQVEVDEGGGPCVLAMAQLRGVLVVDVATETRWDPWRRRAIEVGFRSAAALPGYIATGSLVALNLYSERVDPWDAQMLTVADGFAQQLARAVLERQI
jgi:hypothetical protein